MMKSHCCIPSHLVALDPEPNHRHRLQKHTRLLGWFERSPKQNRPSRVEFSKVNVDKVLSDPARRAAGDGRCQVGIKVRLSLTGHFQANMGMGTGNASSLAASTWVSAIAAFFSSMAGAASLLGARQRRFLFWMVILYMATEKVAGRWSVLASLVMVCSGLHYGTFLLARVLSQ